MSKADAVHRQRFLSVHSPREDRQPGKRTAIESYSPKSPKSPGNSTQ